MHRTICAGEFVVTAPWGTIVRGAHFTLGCTAAETDDIADFVLRRGISIVTDLGQQDTPEEFRNYMRTYRRHQPHEPQQVVVLLMETLGEQVGDDFAFKGPSTYRGERFRSSMR
ncbi:hypothetical protein [Rhodococcus sp. ACT016]|uniref:hypothetical protein n=1 Tax=Rhodococcus sp. ACT016 TaxID=3134808 RepID=UPI003D28E781